jgi:methionyl aminopeptidase
MDQKNERIDVGRTSYEALVFSKTVVKKGASLHDAALKIEEFISKKGYGLSFPVNLSINNKAAHYTPGMDDKSVFGENDIVKVDLGARKGDLLGDCAITIDLSGNNAHFVQTAEDALDAAIHLVKAGVEVRAIGKEIEKVVKQQGYSPIVNLGGHGIEGEELHAGSFIPNFDNGDTTKLEEGQVISIEPFITNGEGRVIESSEIQIYQKLYPAMPRSKEARQIQEIIDKNYLTYPFALRWISKDIPGMSEFGIRRGISELVALGCLEEFPVLVERSGGIVAQAEMELIVEKDSCTVITKA